MIYIPDALKATLVSLGLGAFYGYGGQLLYWAINDVFPYGHTEQFMLGVFGILTGIWISGERDWI